MKMEVQTEQIKITTEFIKLQQLLKFSGAADIGSEAKDMIASGIVTESEDATDARIRRSVKLSGTVTDARLVVLIARSLSRPVDGTV